MISTFSIAKVETMEYNTRTIPTTPRSHLRYLQAHDGFTSIANIESVTNRFLQRRTEGDFIKIMDEIPEDARHTEICCEPISVYQLIDVSAQWSMRRAMIHEMRINVAAISGDDIYEGICAGEFRTENPASRKRARGLSLNYYHGSTALS